MQPTQLNHSEACERNKTPILAVLKTHFSEPGRLLEIGSGTGQHSVYFAQQLPHVIWQTSDRGGYVQDTALRGQLEGSQNWRAPIYLDVLEAWPESSFDYVYSANTAHIMPWAAVEAMFAGVAECLASKGVFCLYGPFNYRGQFTSEGNAEFHHRLVARGEGSGIRDYEAVLALAEKNGLSLEQDLEMPANNRCLIFRNR